MKKLMIAAAMVCAAAFANAASIDWSYSQYAENGVGINLGNYTAYLFTEAAWTTVQGKVTQGKLAMADFTGYLDSAKPTVTPDDWGTEYVTGVRAVTGTTGNYYLVLADAATGVIDFGSRAATQYTEATEGHDVAEWGLWPGDEPSAVTYAWAKQPDPPGPGPEPTPEPTSAMLMLLGAAGLALRRKAK